MTTRDKEIHIPMIEGMDTGDDERLVGGLELMQNARMSQKKTPRKRNGFTALTATTTAGTTISSGNALAVYNNQLLVNSPKKLHAYIEGVSKWSGGQSVGQRFGIYDGHRYGEPLSAYSNSNEPANYANSTAIYGNLIAVATHDGGRYSNGSIHDKDSGRLIVSLSNVAVTPMKAITYDTKIGFLYASGTTIVLSVFNTSTYTFDSTTIITGTSGAVNFDCVAYGTGFAVAYFDSGTEVTVKTFNSSATNVATRTVTEGAGAIEAAISICYDSVNDDFYVVYALTNVNTFYKFVQYPSDLSSNTTTTAYDFGASVQQTVSMGVCTDGTTAWVFINLRTTGDPDNARTYYFTITVPSTVAISGTLLSLKYAPISKPIVIDSEVYIAGVYGYGLYESVSALNDGHVTRCGLLCTLSSGALIPVARWGYGEQHDDTVVTNVSLPMQEIVANGSYYEFIAAKRLSYTDGTNVYWKTEARTIKLKYNDTGISQPIVYNKNLILAGALPYFYDGAGLYEYGFHHRPIITLVAQSGAAGVADGTYAYIATFEYTDKAGVVHVSEPSPVYSFAVTGGPRNVTVTFTNYNIGLLANFCKIHIYRSENGDATTFYRITSNDGVTNAKDSLTGTFVDTNTDAELLNYELFYYNGTVLTPEPPISSNSFWTQGARLFNIPFDKENTIGYSQEASLAGNSRLESGFSDFFEISSDDTNSPFQDFMRCGLSLDDKNVVFKDNSLVAFNGGGPDRSGDNDSFTKPVLVSSDVGCSNPRSLVSCRLGIIFKSKKGIYLLGRDLNLQFIGDQVGAYDSETITGAIDVPNDHYIIFTTAAGVALIFDYLNLKWSIYTNYTANAVTYWQDQLCHLKSNGVVRVEDSNYSDNGDFITQKYTFNWLKFADLMGFVRVKRATILGKWKSAHNLKLSYAYDYELYNDETDTFTPTNTSDYNRTSGPTDAQRQAGANSGAYQVEFHLARQKCEALKLTIEDVDTGTDGECFELTGVGFLVGFKRGKLKLPENKKT